ncbi:hypothetical protein PMAYCL1PPCAC_31959, partial [Pristionchus mayeri]
LILVPLARAYRWGLAEPIASPESEDHKIVYSSFMSPLMRAPTWVKRSYDAKFGQGLERYPYADSQLRFAEKDNRDRNTYDKRDDSSLWQFAESDTKQGQGGHR